MSLQASRIFELGTSEIDTASRTIFGEFSALHIFKAPNVNVSQFDTLTIILFLCKAFLC